MKSIAKYITLATLGITNYCSATSMFVTYPNELKEKFPDGGNIEGHLGHFGHLPYGHSFKGKLHYPVNNKNGCNPFDRKNDFKNDIPFDEKGDMQPILLIDHGSCSHLTKVYNAEKVGFNGVILIEGEALDMTDLRRNPKQHKDDLEKSNKIFIPYFKVLMNEGTILKDYIDKPSPPTVYI